MITVNGAMNDYAIMKQVQQLKLAYMKHSELKIDDPQLAIVTLDANTNFSTLAANETLYLVGHGDPDNGNLRGMDRAILLGWLTDHVRGVPADFGGIVILSCYSGTVGYPPQPSLAPYLAANLSVRVSPDTPVRGANGWSFGTPEFQESGLSSVLPYDLLAFYVAEVPKQMAKAWLAHKPTHTGGVLKDRLHLNVNSFQTIQEQLVAAKDTLTEDPKVIAQEYATLFANEAKAIEAQLQDIIANRIKGGTVAARADYLLSNSDEPDVKAWNDAINAQYKMYGDMYLWASEDDAFTVAKTT